MWLLVSFDHGANDEKSRPLTAGVIHPYLTLQPIPLQTLSAG